MPSQHNLQKIILLELIAKIIKKFFQHQIQQFPGMVENMEYSSSKNTVTMISRIIIIACAVVFFWHSASFADLLDQTRTGATNITKTFPMIIAPICLMLGVTIGFKWSIIGRTLLISSAGLALITANSDFPTPGKYWTILVLSAIAIAFLEYRQFKRRAEA